MSITSTLTSYFAPPRVRLAWLRARGSVRGRCPPQRRPEPRKAHDRRVRILPRFAGGSRSGRAGDLRDRVQIVGNSFEQEGAGRAGERMAGRAANEETAPDQGDARAGRPTRNAHD